MRAGTFKAGRVLDFVLSRCVIVEVCNHTAFVLSIEFLELRRISGPLNPPSSRSSCLCGQRICFMWIALIIITKTQSHITIRMQVATQPIICIVNDPKDFPTANVAVTRPVLGNTNENQVMANCRPPLPMHVQWAPTEIKKNQIARLLIDQHFS